MSLRIFPATDLHLLNGTSASLRCFAHFGGVWTDLSAVGGFSVQFNPMPAFATLSGLSITGTAAGSAVTRVFLTDPIRGFNISAPMRISVHRELRRLFLPRNSLQLEAGRDDRVLTVYGEFQASDGSIITADITAHPYLRYRVNVGSGTSGVAVSPAGRVTSGSAAGAVEIEVSVDPSLNQPAPAAKLNVTIVAAVTDRPILTRFHTGAAISKKSILFLPDGFTLAQQNEFNTLASKVGRKLLQAISPYRHLREAFDLYSAFVPSDEEGVTIGPPILARPGSADVGFSLPLDQPIQQNAILLTDLLFHLGHPATSAVTTLAAARAQLGVNAQQLPQSLFDLWQSLRAQPPQSRVRETSFGIMIGDRHHGTEAIIEPVPAPPVPNWPPLDAAIFLGRGEIRTLLFDERRLPDLTTTDPHSAHLPALSQFVRTLRVAGETPGQGSVWLPPTGDGTNTGDSFDLIVFIARADHYGGVRQAGCLLLSFGPGMIHHTEASTAVPRLLEVVPVPRPISATNRALGFQERPLDSLVDVVAHELAHSPALGSLNDEYGGRTHPPDPTDSDDATFVEESPNCQLIANSQAGAGPGLNSQQIKWNWERAEGAARVETIRANGAEIEIGITTEDAFQWPTLAVGRLLILRGRNLAVPASGSAHVGAKPAAAPPQSLNLVAFDRANQLIRCSVLGTATAAQVAAGFRPGDVIVAPRLLAGATMQIIPAALGARLASSGPFNPSGAGCVETIPPVPPNIPGFVWPANHLQAIAAYEAGAGFNCGAIRPSGECKMRTVVQLTEPPVEFCYVCKYAMTYLIQPAQLAAIDAEYP